MSDTTFTIDASQAFAQFDAIEKRLSELEARSKQAAEATKKVFTPGGNLARQEIAAIDQAQREYNELAVAATRLKAARDAAFDPRAINTYTKAIDQAEAEMKNLERAAKATGVDLQEALKPPDTGKGLADQLFGNLKGAALAATAGISFGAAISEGIALNAEYERIKTSLTVILKDADKADKLLGKLNQFAAETPFQSEQINQAATALLAFGVGEEEVITRLREIGTLSAATGKDFNELTTIYGKARVAGVLYAEDINQLVEAGVPIIGEFAKQLGVSESKVKKLASEGKIGFDQLQVAFTNLTSEGGRFDGLLQKQSETLTGVASTLKDLFSQGLRNFFAPIAESLRDGGKALIAFLQPAQATAAAFGEQSRKVDSLNKNLVPLLDRYDQLTKKTNPTKKEQAELGEVIKQIGVITPGAITEIDKYGNALSINADKSRAFLEAERARLKFVNEEAIKATQSAKDQAEQEAKILQDRIKAGKQVVVETGTGGGGLFGAGSAAATAKEVTLTAKQIEDITKKVGELTERAKGADAELKRLKGEAPEPDKTPGPTPPPTGGGLSADQIKKQQQAIEKALESLAKVRDAIAPDNLEEALLQVNRKYDDLAKATTAGIETLEKEEARRGKLKPEQKKALEEAKVFSISIEEKRFEDLLNVLEEFNRKEAELNKKQEEAKKALAEKTVATNKAELEKEKDVRDDIIKLQEERGKRLVALAKKTGSSEREIAELQRQFDLATQKARLESELKFQQGLLAIVGETNQEQADGIKRAIAQIQAQIATLEIEAAPSSDKKKKSIWDMLGIDTSTESGQAILGNIEKFFEAAQEVNAQFLNSLKDVADQRAALAEAEVQRSDDRLSTLQTELDREIELAELGFASNVTLKRKELEEEKKRNAQAKAELEKAKKSQLAIDTAIQASSLITTIANLFKSLSGLPFGAGIPIAIALSGAMLAFFVKSKVDAAKAAKARYGATGFIDDSGIVHGKYHTHGGQLLEVENGEMVQVGEDGSRKRLSVVRRERVTEYFNLLDAANRGDRRALVEEALKIADIEDLPPRVQRQIVEKYFGGQATTIQKQEQNRLLQSATERTNTEKVYRTLFVTLVPKIAVLPLPVQHEILSEYSSRTFSDHESEARHFAETVLRKVYTETERAGAKPARIEDGLTTPEAIRGELQRGIRDYVAIAGDAEPGTESKEVQRLIMEQHRESALKQESVKREKEAVRREIVQIWQIRREIAGQTDSAENQTIAKLLPVISALPIESQRQILSEYRVTEFNNRESEAKRFSYLVNKAVFAQHQKVVQRDIVSETKRFSEIEHERTAEISREIIMQKAVQEIKAMTPALQRDTLHRFQRVVFNDSEMPRYTNGPTVHQKRVTRHVFGEGDIVTVRVDGGDAKRTNELLEHLIRLQMEQAKSERWSADGRTKFKGSNKTRYLN